jgi:hypothetical protein
MRRTLAIVVLVILIVSIGTYLRTISVKESIVDVPLRSDAGDYFACAYNLRHKHTYSRELRNIADINSPVAPDAVRPPGYPFFLAMFVNGAPNRSMIDRILYAQTLVSVTALILCYFVYRSFLPWGLALGATLLLTFSPHLIVANSYVLTESLFCSLLVLLAWVMSRFVKEPSAGKALLLGAALGLANLVRPGLQYFPFLLAIYIASQLHFSRKGWRLGVLTLAGFLMVLAPWLIRNWVTLHTPALSDGTKMVEFIHHGMYPNFMYENRRETFGYPYRFDPRVNEIGSSLSTVFSEVARRFKEQPAEHLKWFLVGKPMSLWEWSIVQGVGDVFVYPVRNSPYHTSILFVFSHSFMRNSHGLLVIFMAIGCGLAWLPRGWLGIPMPTVHMVRFVSLLLVYFTLIHMIGAPFPRYSIPLRPFSYGMALFAFYGIFLLSVGKNRSDKIMSQP